MSRVALLFAVELGVQVEFSPVVDLMSTDVEAFGGNPSLKVPSLLLGDTAVFGALNVCRKLALLSEKKAFILWPEGMQHQLSVNALEVTLNAMGSEVFLLMNRMGSGESAGPLSPALQKTRKSLEGGTAWLEDKLPSVLDLLPPGRDLSYFEVCLFCYLDHLEWREVMSLHDFPQLREFRDEFMRRPSAQATAYYFDG